MPGSDVDLLIVVTHSDETFLNRMLTYAPNDIPLGVDVLPHTESEFEQMLKDGNGFVQRAIEEGMVLYDAKMESLTHAN